MIDFWEMYFWRVLGELEKGNCDVFRKVFVKNRYIKRLYNSFIGGGTSCTIIEKLLRELDELDCCIMKIIKRSIL